MWAVRSPCCVKRSDAESVFMQLAQLDWLLGSSILPSPVNCTRERGLLEWYPAAPPFRERDNRSDRRDDRWLDLRDLDIVTDLRYAHSTAPQTYSNKPVELDTVLLVRLLLKVCRYERSSTHLSSVSSSSALPHACCPPMSHHRSYTGKRLANIEAGRVTSKEAWRALDVMDGL